MTFRPPLDGGEPADVMDAMSRGKRYCGRDFTARELAAVRDLIADCAGASRAALSRLVCEHLHWRRPDGGLKDMSCRVAMIRMADDGLIRLPPPRRTNGNGKPYRRRTPRTQPPPSPLLVPADALAELRLEQPSDRRESHLWNEYIDRYHYLGYGPLPGAQLRYFIRGGDRVLALLGFGAAAWKTAPRDRFIGWDDDRRRQRLHLVVNNARFLILPWVRGPNLASRILGLTARRIADDWQRRYRYRPVLMETFVEKPRFVGTCYQAAGWICVGETKGRGKLDVRNQAQLPVKSIWLRPLDKNFRRILLA